jgi:hypothetical protein
MTICWLLGCSRQYRENCGLASTPPVQTPTSYSLDVETDSFPIDNPPPTQATGMALLLIGAGPAARLQNSAEQRSCASDSAEYLSREIVEECADPQETGIDREDQPAFLILSSRVVQIPMLSPLSLLCS